MMKTKLNCILLVDDDDDDNFFHQIIINDMDIVHKIDVAMNGIEALEYLKREHQTPPDIIFLDINMPKMNGWEFLEHYKDLSETQRGKALVVMLSTSANPDDIKRAKELQVITAFATKPLTKELLMELLQQHFQHYL